MPAAARWEPAEIFFAGPDADIEEPPLAEAVVQCRAGGGLNGEGHGEKEARCILIFYDEEQACPLACLRQVCLSCDPLANTWFESSMLSSY